MQTPISATISFYCWKFSGLAFSLIQVLISIPKFFNTFISVFVVVRVAK